MGSLDVATLKICGSNMPSGRSLRIWSTAFFTSLTAALISSPISNSALTVVLPSLELASMLRTPCTLRIADSTFCVIWVVISLGAAPGCEIETTTTGNSISGSFCTSMFMNDMMPAMLSATNKTIGTTGLRMDHAEMLFKFMISIPNGPKTYCFFNSLGLINSSGLRKPPA